MTRELTTQRVIGLCIALLLFGVTLLSVDRRQVFSLIRLETTRARSATAVDDRSQQTATDNSTTTTSIHREIIPLASLSNTTVGLVDYCVGDSYETLKKLIAYNRQAYANKWGYKIFSGNEDNFPLQTFVDPPAWLKAAYFYQLLTSVQAQDIEWFLWIDCDALITRFDLSVDHVLQDLSLRPFHDIVVAQDPHTEFNSGVMFVRNSEWSRDLWKRTLQQAKDITIREHKWWEQQALLELYREDKYEERKHILITSDRWKINAFQTFRRNEYNASSFAIHRVNCRKQPECNELFESFFCVTMPNGSFPEELVDCSNATDSFMESDSN